MRGKWLWIIPVVGVALLALSLFIAACAPATPQIVEVTKEVVVEKEVVKTVVVEKEVPVLVTPTPEVKKPVKIELWVDPRFDPQTAKGHPELKTALDYEKMVANDYIKNNPHVSVEIQVLDWADLPKKVPVAIAGGVPPDILRDYLGRTSAYAYEGVTVNLEEVVPKEELADFLPGLLELYTINGHLHGLPIFYWVQNMVVNAAPFEKAGLLDMLPLDDHDWTFDEFYAAAKAIKEANVGVEYPLVMQVASEQGDYAVHAFIWGAGSNTWRDDCQGLDLDNPQALAAMEFLNKLYKEGLINPDVTTAGWQDVNNLFYAGKGVFMGGGISTVNVSIPQAQKEGKVTAPMDARLTLYPHLGDKPSGLPVGPTGLVMFQKQGRSDYELQEITKFLIHLSSEKWQRDYCISSGQFPTRYSVGAPLAGDPNYELTLEWIKKYGVVSMGLNCPHYYEVRTAMPAFFQAMFLGKMTPQEAINGMMKASKDIFGK
jgi:ABC-type glycerol-3-phosphate transport system substrate-binding protein